MSTKGDIIIIIIIIISRLYINHPYINVHSKGMSML
jgi:hypothetical protein